MSSDMGVCSFCGDTFSRCGDHESCDCGKSWCSESCAEADGLQEEENGYIPPGETWEQDSSCDYCRKEDYKDSELLEYALTKMLNMSRYELVAHYNASKE